MPTYEAPLLFRIMQKEELREALKRASNAIFNTGGFIRAIENWGQKELPCRTSAHGTRHREASHFMIRFDAPPRSIEKLADEYRRDIDIVRINIYRQNEPVEQECTLHNELLPPPYRESVQKLLKKAKQQELKKQKKNFQHKSGLDYYPFHK